MYQRLTAIKEAYGFRNICELNVAMLNLLIAHLDAMQQLQDTEGAAEIDNLFTSLRDYEAPQYGSRTKRTKQPNMK